MTIPGILFQFRFRSDWAKYVCNQDLMSLSSVLFSQVMSNTLSLRKDGLNPETILVNVSA